MYRGGEKGGYATEDFNRRYKKRAESVENGARRNHRKLVNETLPEIYKANELKAAGFSKYDVADDLVMMRAELMARYGGPENQKARADLRKS